MIGYFDRDGNTIDMRTWIRLINSSYQRVALTNVLDLAAPDLTYDVSTVWLGMDHGFGEGPPIIFETMIFGEGELDSVCRRYATEAQALAGHGEMIAIVRAAMTDPLTSMTQNGRATGRRGDRAGD